MLYAAPKEQLELGPRAGLDAVMARVPGAAEMLGISVRTLRNKLNGPGRTGEHESVDDEPEG